MYPRAGSLDGYFYYVCYATQTRSAIDLSPIVAKVSNFDFTIRVRAMLPGRCSKLPFLDQLQVRSKETNTVAGLGT